MSAFEIIENVFLFLAGLGVFLYGIQSLGDNLETVAGDKLRIMFNKISNNRFMGVGIGAGVTALIQSSSATTVMVVGFVNAGIMTLTQATSVIMGANIGTTITAQIMSLEALNVTIYISALTCVGAFMLMSAKGSKIYKIGAALLGLGMIFVGLHLMSTTMGQFKELEAFKNFLQSTDNAFVLFIFGALFTALIQSSSAATGILIAMGSNGLMVIDSIIWVILGVNIGTCITAVLAAIGTTTNAKRTAAIHLIFNVFGSIFFAIIISCMQAGNYSMGTMLETLFPGNVATQLAMFHTFFNVITTLLLLGFIKQIVQLATLCVPDKRRTKKGVDISDKVEVETLKFIDERMLNTPAIAIAQVKKEILYMFELAKFNFDRAMNSICKKTLSEKEDFETTEKQLNFLNRAIAGYLVKISSLDISFRDELMIGSLYHVVSDIERIGDYAENIVEYTQKSVEENIEFSEDAIKEIKLMTQSTINLYENVYEAFSKCDLSMLDDVNKYENEVDEWKRILNIRHVERLNQGICSPASGAVFLSLISNMERIGDHMTNIANSIKDYAKIQNKSVDAKIISGTDMKKKKDKNKDDKDIKKDGNDIKNQELKEEKNSTVNE